MNARLLSKALATYKKRLVMKENIMIEDLIDVRLVKLFNCLINICTVFLTYII